MARTRKVEPEKFSPERCQEWRESVSRVLHETKEQSGLSLRAIAEGCGVTHPTIKQWLNGHCTLYELLALCYVLGIRPDDLFWEASADCPWW